MSCSIRANRAATAWDEQTRCSVGILRRFTGVWHLNLCLLEINAGAEHTVLRTYLNSGFLPAYGGVNFAPAAPVPWPQGGMQMPGQISGVT